MVIASTYTPTPEIEEFISSLAGRYDELQEDAIGGCTLSGNFGI